MLSKSKPLSKRRLIMPEFDLDNIFMYHPPKDDDTVKTYQVLREAAKEFASIIIEHTPAGADQSAAIRKVREAVMTANAAVALEGRLHKD